MLPRTDLFPALGLAAALVLLGGCRAERADPAAATTDPVVAEALADELMADPDLARQNPAGAVLTGGGPAAAPLPPEELDPERIAAARTEAQALVGGRVLRAPAAVAGAGSATGDTAALTARAALAERGSATACASRLEYTFAWAARLPAAFPVYPRGHVEQAAGTDAAGCRVRVVTYRTPVAIDDVVDFYWTRARRAGFAAEHRLRGADHALGGARGAAAFTVYVRSHGGLSQVDLVTSGG